MEIAIIEACAIVWLHCSGNHYQLVVPRQDFVLVHPPANASPKQNVDQAELSSCCLTCVPMCCMAVAGVPVKFDCHGVAL